MTTRVSLHDYWTDPLLPQKDGVNLAHENIASLMRRQTDPALIVTFHDFTRLIANEDYARSVLKDVDCVISNVGPHAHFYFWLRERLGLDYRIIRDVRTAIWSSYLHQEHLCAPYLRPYDTLLVASNYTWSIYHKIFPHLASFPTLLCYPLTACFPTIRPEHRSPYRPPGGDFTLGYLGRLSEDKNFPDIVELLIRLNRDPDRRHHYRLVACGDVHSKSCAPHRVEQHIAEALGPGDFFEYLPARDNSAIWDVMARFNVMIFPSTSNLETLGRVLIEASYARVPILCSDHAAAGELVAPGGLCGVEYRQEETFNTHFDHRLGSIRIPDMIEVIRQRTFGVSNCYEHYDRHPELFLARIADPAPPLAMPQLTTAQQAFIDRLSVCLPAPIGREAADAELAELACWFIDLQRKDDPARETKLVRLAEITRHPQRTAAFVLKSEATSGDF
ncbi:MAG: glycosyltransferase, partial [Rhizobiales bacterium]|nr:glycosyltransferase [Hyphomicrobiales bacterium]